MKKDLDLAREVIEDPQYREMLLARARNGILPPDLEKLLFHYYYGKPIDKREIDIRDSRKDELEKLSDAELAEKARKLAEELKALGAVKSEENPGVAS